MSGLEGYVCVHSIEEHTFTTSTLQVYMICVIIFHEALAYQLQ